MRKLILLSLLAAPAVTAPANAAITLLANGILTGSSAGDGVDLSGLTGKLENGLPGNILGGLGSGLTYAGGNTFLALPDRGPNATPYNSAVDDTVSYISRFQTITMTLAANAPGATLPYSLTPVLTGTTLLSSKTPLVYGTGAGLGNQIDGVTPIGSGAPAKNADGNYYFTGRSDNFDPSKPSTYAADARLDPESIRVSNDGKSVFISDEYGPYVRQFDRATGSLIKTFAVPTDLAASTLSPQGQVEIDGNTSGRVANKGMEGLAITPDGKTLVGIMQAPLEQDARNTNPGIDTSKLLRIVTIDIATGKTHEYGYQLTAGSGVSDITAINDHEFLVDERDGKGLGDIGADGTSSKAKVKDLFTIDISGATDISGKKPADLAKDIADGKTINYAVKSASPFIDLVDQLTNTLGLKKDQIPSKIEGISFGQDIDVNGVLTHTLYVSNDNDFVPADAGPNQFYVFGFTDADLAGLDRQHLISAVPEPASWAMMIGGFGLIGAAMRRRTTVRVTFA